MLNTNDVQDVILTLTELTKPAPLKFLQLFQHNFLAELILNINLTSMQIIWTLFALLLSSIQLTLLIYLLFLLLIQSPLKSLLQVKLLTNSHLSLIITILTYNYLFILTAQ